MPTQPGTQIGEYTLIRPLGSGGMGEVWLAKKDGIGKPFVVKLLLPELCTNPAHRRRFLREAKIVAELPEGNIVPVVDYGEAGDRLFLVMAFIDGVNLQTFNEAVLARGGRLPFTVVAYILAEILEALRDAHTHVVADRLRPVIHRDVKPSNVLVSSRGRVFLTDFGIALYDNDYSLETFGTLAYMAPEQARGVAPQPQADIFGVGGIAHYLFTGKAPRHVRNLVELHEVLDRPPPLTERDDIPRELEVLRVTALDPAVASRFATAGDLLSLIEGWKDYRRATTSIAELYQRLIAGVRSGTTEMLAQAQAEAAEPRLTRRTITMRDPSGQPVGSFARVDPSEENRALRWEDAAEPAPQAEAEPEVDLDDVTTVFRPRRPPIPPLDLAGVPEAFIPRPQGKVDQDAPKVRRRPRDGAYVEITERLSSPADRGGTDGTDGTEGREEGSR